MLLPEGLVIPPVPVLLFLGVGLALITLGLFRLDPPVTSWTVLAFVPWMGLGGGLHVLDVLNIGPLFLHHFLAAPAVYISTLLLAGGVWIVVSTSLVQQAAGKSPEWLLGTVGLVGLGMVTSLIGIIGYEFGSLSLWWPLVGLVSGIIVTAVVWLLFTRLVPAAATATGLSGVVVIFGHVLDGVSTTIGIDVLGMGERTPLPLQIMDLAGSLPVTDLIGVGWAFVLVKIIIASVVVWLFADFVRETPRQAHLLLAAIAAVGLGPAIHNLLLFAVAG